MNGIYERIIANALVEPCSVTISRLIASYFAFAWLLGLSVGNVCDRA
jgi:hypothetical protein